MSKPSTRTTRVGLLRSERGAIFIHTAVAFLGLTAFSTFVADYGMLWTARRQAQNSADAAALAAANSLGYVGITNVAAARAAAIRAAQTNLVWGQAPVITDGDITIGAGVCPADAPPNGVCVRTNVFRNQARSNPLPTWFGAVVGISAQGVQATATAEVRFGRASAECVKPLAIPDKWFERQTPPWDMTDRFDRLDCQGNGNNCSPFVPPALPDLFVAPPNGSGFDGRAFRDDNVTRADLGLQVTIKFARGQSQLEPGMYAPVRLGTSTGASDYEDNLVGCWNGTVDVGHVLGVEPGGKKGPTAQAFQTIIARDPSASWTGTDGNGLGGRVTGGCTAAGTCGTVSPRIIPIIAFDPNIWSADPNGGPGAGGPSGGGGGGGGGNNNCDPGEEGCNWNGPGSVTVTQVLGVFVEQVTNQNQIIGRITRVPTLGLIGTGTGGDANMVNIILVR